MNAPLPFSLLFFQHTLELASLVTVVIW